MKELTYSQRAAELVELGYMYCNSSRWWWNPHQKTCVDDQTIKRHYTHFSESILNSCLFRDYNFFSYRRMNQDILDTVFKFHFPATKFLPRSEG